MKTLIEIIRALVCAALFVFIFFPIWLTLTVIEMLRNPRR